MIPEDNGCKDFWLKLALTKQHHCCPWDVHVDALMVGGGVQGMVLGKQSLVRKSSSENQIILPKHYGFKFTES